MSMKKTFFILFIMAVLGGSSVSYGQIDPGSVGQKAKDVTVMFTEEAQLDEKQIIVFQREYEKALVNYVTHQQQSPTGDVSAAVISSLNTELKA